MYYYKIMYIFQIIMINSYRSLSIVRIVHTSSRKYYDEHIIIYFTFTLIENYIIYYFIIFILIIRHLYYTSVNSD